MCLFYMAIFLKCFNPYKHIWFVAWFMYTHTHIHMYIYKHTQTPLHEFFHKDLCMNMHTNIFLFSNYNNLYIHSIYNICTHTHRDAYKPLFLNDKEAIHTNLLMTYTSTDKLKMLKKMLISSILILKKNSQRFSTRQNKAFRTWLVIINNWTIFLNDKNISQSLKIVAKILSIDF